MSMSFPETCGFRLERRYALRSVVRGRRGPLSNVTPVLTITAGAEHKTVEMSALGGAFEYVIPALDRTFSYRVSAGRAHSADYSVTALSAPRVTRIDLGYVYPHSSGWRRARSRTAATSTLRPGPACACASTPTSRSWPGNSLSGDRTVPLRPASDGTGEAEITLARDDSYRVSLPIVTGCIRLAAASTSFASWTTGRRQ